MACGKERFLTFALAERVAKLARNRHDQVKLQPYRCAECGAFHIGSSIGPSRARRGRLTVLERA